MIKLTALIFLFTLSSFAKEVDLQWEPIESATQYEIKIESLNNKEQKTLRKKLTESKWKGDLPAGHYSMTIRSYDERKVPGDWSESVDFWIKLRVPLIISPKHKSKISSDSDIEQNVEFKWEKLDDAKFYKVGIQSKDKSINIEKIADKESIIIPLKPTMVYSWSVVALTSKDDTSPLAKKKMKFVVLGNQMEPPKIKDIETKYVQTVGWAPSQKATKYSYALMRKNKKDKWKIVEKKKNVKKTEIPFNKDYLGGTYQILVKAYGKLRRSSEFAKKEFEVAFGDRGPASAKLNEIKESLEKPTKYYLIASWFLSSLSIASEYDDAFSSGTTIDDALGGTGRIGLGYQSTDGPWGALAIGDQSGFKLDGENKTYSSFELMGTWKKSFASGSQLQFGLGLYEKELPLVYNNGTTAPAYEILSQGGLTLSSQYWKPFTKTYGMQLKGQVYMGGESGSTPNGRATVPSTSFQFSVFGSKRISKNIFGYMGYTFKEESIEFVPTLPIENNFSSISGHFFSLKLELGF